MSGSELLEQLRGVFFEEAFEGLETMESALMALDEAPQDEDTLNQIFRAAHSIKGGAGSFGFGAITRFTHGMETLLDELRSGRRAVEPPVVDVLLRAVDQLRALVEGAAEGAPVDEARTRALTEELEQTLSGSPGPTGSPSAEAGASPPADPTAEAPATSGPGFVIRFEPHLDLMSTGNDPVLIFRELGALGALEVRPRTDRVPSIELLDPEQMHLGWTLELRTDADEAAVREVFDWVESDCDLTVEPLGSLPSPATGESAEAAGDVAEAAGAPTGSGPDRAPVQPAAPVAPAGFGSAEAPEPLAEPSSPSPRPSPPAAEPAEPAPSSGPSPVASGSAADPQSPGGAPSSSSRAPAEGGRAGKPAAASIRVGIDKVDALMDIVGELVITQSMLCQIEKDFDLSRLANLRDGLGELTRNTRQLQESVMRLRMVPISFLFSRFPRVVRDVRGALGKKVELELVGESTEVDKTVAEQLADPLVHLVRNALDHGLETPEGRREAGKDEIGHLRLSARHEGGSVVIEVEDDGRGIDPDRILAKARTRGLVGPGDRPSDERVFELLFAPGFSTAEKVTDLSGRGVGLDVVARNIRSLGGTIDIQSRVGAGSCFSIRLPLTLSILEAQLVRLSDQVFIVPLLSIVESVLVHPDQINALGGSREIYRLREEYIPMIRASEMLGIERGADEAEPRLLMVVEANGHRAGVLVDELLDQQQVVIKSLETNFRSVAGLSGATILGDGRVAYIIDVAGFVRLAAERVAEVEESREERIHDGR